MAEHNNLESRGCQVGRYPGLTFGRFGNPTELDCKLFIQFARALSRGDEETGLSRDIFSIVWEELISYIHV